MLFRRGRGYFNKLFADRYIVFSSSKGSRSYCLSTIIQIVFVLTILSFSLWAWFVIAGFFNKKRSIDVVYKEVSELRSVNDDLVSKIELIDKDLSEFSSRFTGKKAKRLIDNNTKKVFSNDYKGRSDLVSGLLEKSVVDFTHAVNTRMGFLLNSFHSIGFDPYRFIPESKAKLDKVRLSSARIVSPKASAKDFYKKRLTHYYYRPKFLEKSLDTSIAKVNIGVGKVISILSTMESIFRSLPIGAPMKGGLIITSRYGIRSDPFSSNKRMHSGVDLVRSDGAKVIATGKGVVAFAGYKNGYGYTIDINHGYGIRSRYAHMREVTVKTGQNVSASQHIGYQGKTGSRCRGSHLHYEVRQNNATINPLKYIYAKNNFQKGQVAYFSGKK